MYEKKRSLRVLERNLESQTRQAGQQSFYWKVDYHSRTRREKGTSERTKAKDKLSQRDLYFKKFHFYKLSLSSVIFSR